ncbi:MAG: ABC transporter ATP-binding protein [Nitrospirae bacterium RBG_19FT_COMBO_55_12]|nr:MAG: ABC transporter ATP-binding protein [Nitrospirae bacterium RBG_19FT_COMBO_55_12]
MSLIELSNASKVYQASEDKYAALNNISLAIDSGEFVAVMGPSGSGKSTLLSIIGGLSRASSGIVSVDGIDLGGLGPDRLADFRREYVGFVFQSFYLVPYLTALENVMLPLAVQPRVNGTGRKDRALAALGQVGMDSKAQRLPSQLSGGEQERVAIARALVNQPPLILADEPTGNLDTRTGNHVLDVLAGLHAGGHTIVMVTHNEENARRAGRIVEIRDGEIVR